MINVGIVPTKYGYCGVGLRSSLGKDGEFTIHTPIPLSRDTVLRIQAAFSKEIADYLYEVSTSQGVGLLFFIWTALGGLALLTSEMWGYGLKLALLYGWVRVWFLADGLWFFLPYLARWPHRRRAKRLGKFLEEFNGQPEVKFHGEWPELANVPADLSEEDTLQEMARRFPICGDYYQQMLWIDPPLVFDKVPFSIRGRIRNLILGTPIRLPHLVHYLGESL